MMENITHKMARFTRNLQFEDLSPEAVYLAKRFLLSQYSSMNSPCGTFLS